MKVLFVCTHNAARSQMAQTFLKKLGGDAFEVESAGLEQGELNPVVVAAMKEVGVDISQNKRQCVFDLYKQGRRFDYVITVCSKEARQRCPIFPGICKRLHWSFDDPATFEGSFEEKLAQTRIVRDAIKKKIEEFIAQSQQNP